MPTRDPSDPAELNPELARRIATRETSPINVLIQVEPGTVEGVLPNITQFDDATVDTDSIILGEYIPAVLPSESLDEIRNIDGVVLIHHDQPMGALGVPTPLEAARLVGEQNDPLRRRLSSAAYDAFAADDPLLDGAGISPVEAPRVNFSQIPPGDPLQGSASILQRISGRSVTGKTFVSTVSSKRWMLDGSVTDGFDPDGASVAVLDTGHTPTPLSEPDGGGYTESRVPGEPAQDGHSHGTWCTNTVVGSRAPAVWGFVDGVASGADYAHFKCLNTFPGFGRTSWILKSMERANQWGADVISMSLGGPQQGPVGVDPYTQVIDELCKENLGEDAGSIFVVAAGNSGPDRWTIGSPGISPKALTVGAWSLTDNAPSLFSSRGPQGSWYAGSPDRYQEDLSAFGEGEFVKPDVTAPGGGRANATKADESDELLHQATVGWLEGLHDGLKDARGNMKGTSMATPHAAGLVLRLYEAGIINTAGEIKRVVRQNGQLPSFPDATETAREAEGDKNIAAGYGRLRESVFEPGNNTQQ
jgi:hypothetical protein